MIIRHTCDGQTRLVQCKEISHNPNAVPPNANSASGSIVIDRDFAAIIWYGIVEVLNDKFEILSTYYLADFPNYKEGLQSGSSNKSVLAIVEREDGK